MNGVTHIDANIAEFNISDSTGNAVVGRRGPDFESTSLDAIRSALPEDGIFVDEMTQLGYVSRAAFPVYSPRTFISPGYQGTLGWGMPTAIGAKVARPTHVVVSVIGDGGALFNIGELATAIQHRIPFVTVLFNDNAYGNVMRIQDNVYGGRRVGSELHNPDFLKLAESFGALAIRAATPSSLQSALIEAIKKNEPAVIEVPVPSFPDPWQVLRYKTSRRH